MSRSTVGDPSVGSEQSFGSDWQSTRTTSTTVVSSKTTECTSRCTSTGSSNGGGIGGMTLEIYVKLVLVGITFFGGAILALCINVFRNSGRTLTAEEIRHQLLSGVAESKKYRSMANCLFKNKGSTLCLNDYNVTNHEEHSVDFLRLQECKDFYAKDQFFSFKDNSLKVTRDSKKKDDICAIAENPNVKMVPCMSDRIDQLWSYMKTHQIYHYKTKQCLSGRDGKDGDLATLEICDDKDANQVWKCNKVSKLLDDSSAGVKTIKVKKPFVFPKPRE